MVRKIFTMLFAVAFGAAFARMDVQALAPGMNTLAGGPGVVSQIEAVAADATGTITVKRVIDRVTYAQAASTVTNSFTNAVAWTTRTVTNKVVSVEDVYTVVTNAVYTNVVLGETNVIRNITRRPNGTRIVTNDVVTVRPHWTQTPVPFSTGTVTNDVISHAFITNTIGTITLSNNIGTLAPSNLHFTAGDKLLIETGSLTGVKIRLYATEE